MHFLTNVCGSFKISRLFAAIPNSLKCTRPLSLSVASVLDSLGEAVARLNGYAPEPSPKTIKSSRSFHGVDLEDNFAWLQNLHSKVKRI